MKTMPLIVEGVFSKKIDTSFVISSGATAVSQVISMGAMQNISSYASYSHSNNRIDISKSGKYLIDIDLAARVIHGHGNSATTQKMTWGFEDQTSTLFAYIQTQRIAVGNSVVLNNSFISQAAVLANNLSAFSIGTAPGNQAANGVTYTARLVFRQVVFLDSGNWIRMRAIKDANGNADSFNGEFTGTFGLIKVT